MTIYKLEIEEKFLAINDNIKNISNKIASEQLSLKNEIDEIKAVTTEINEKVNSFKEDNSKNTVEFENITTSLNFTKGKFTQAFLLVFYQMLFSFQNFR